MFQQMPDVRHLIYRNVFFLHTKIYLKLQIESCFAAKKMMVTDAMQLLIFSFVVQFRRPSSVQ